MMWLIEITKCPKCGKDVRKPYRTDLKKMFGNMTLCPCGKEFFVTWSILRDNETGRAISAFKRERGMDAKQTTLEEFQE